MLSSFIIVLREGFEAFLIVAIAVAYLRKSGRDELVRAVYWGILASVLASAAVGYVLLLGVDQAFWEGVLGLVAMVMVTSLVVHMWRTGPRIGGQIRARLDEASSKPTSWAAFLGVFTFTVLMITREGMETALMLFQLRKAHLIAGCVLGVLAAAAMAYLWGRYGHRIDLHRFFQVTGIFLLLFVLQIGSPLLVVMIIGLGTAGHQAFSSNIFTMISDLYPRRAVATVAGLGGAAGAVGGMLIAKVTGWSLEYLGSYTPVLIYAGIAYLLALSLIQLLVPRMEPAPV